PNVRRRPRVSMMDMTNYAPSAQCSVRAWFARARSDSGSQASRPLARSSIRARTHSSSARLSASAYSASTTSTLGSLPAAAPRPGPCRGRRDRAGGVPPPPLQVLLDLARPEGGEVGERGDGLRELVVRHLGQQVGGPAAHLLAAVVGRAVDGPLRPPALPA